MTSTPTLAETVAAEVRAEMARQRKSGRAVAEALGVNDMYLSRRLSGQVAFDIDELSRLAGVLGVRLSQFLPDDGATTSERVA